MFMAISTAINLNNGTSKTESICRNQTIGDSFSKQLIVCVRLPHKKRTPCLQYSENAFPQKL